MANRSTVLALVEAVLSTAHPTHQSGPMRPLDVIWVRACRSSQTRGSVVSDADSANKRNERKCHPALPRVTEPCHPRAFPSSDPCDRRGRSTR
jgi:hypothetical protein